MNGSAEHKTPSRAAPVANVALSGKRRQDVVRVARPAASDRNTNSKSSNATANLTKLNQDRNSREP